MPKPISQITPITDITMRGQLLTLSAAPRSAASFTWSTRRSAHSNWVASITTPASTMSTPGPGNGIRTMPTATTRNPSAPTRYRLTVLFTPSAYECVHNRSRLVVARVLVVGPGPGRPRQLLGRAYDDQLVASGQQRDGRVEVAVDLLVADHRDHLVGQRLRCLAHLAHHQVALGDLEPLAVGEQVLHHRAEVG